MNNKSTRSKVRGNVSSVFIIDFGYDDTFRLGIVSVVSVKSQRRYAL